MIINSKNGNLILDPKDMGIILMGLELVKERKAEDLGFTSKITPAYVNDLSFELNRSWAWGKEIEMPLVKKLPKAN